MEVCTSNTYTDVLYGGEMSVHSLRETFHTAQIGVHVETTGNSVADAGGGGGGCKGLTRA